MGINIDFKLLPMKAHYFLYNAGKFKCFFYFLKGFASSVLQESDNEQKLELNGSFFRILIKEEFVVFFRLFLGTGSVVPYMPVLARQLGFSTFVVGSIYTVLPILGLISKPLFGAIADR